MEQACDDVILFTQGMHSVEELEADRRTLLAVIRSLEVLGEAARQLPQRFKEKYPEIPWREISSLRNLIAHEYFGLDLDIIWDVIQTQIPALSYKIRTIMKD